MTFSPVMGQTPPLARVLPITATVSQLTLNKCSLKWLKKGHDHIQFPRVLWVFDEKPTVRFAKRGLVSHEVNIMHSIFRTEIFAKMKFRKLFFAKQPAKINLNFFLIKNTGLLTRRL